MRKQILSILALMSVLSCEKAERTPQASLVDSKIIGSAQAEYSAQLYVKIAPGITPESAGLKDFETAQLFAGRMAHGLDRWYSVALPEGADIVDMAESLAASEGIETVQYPSGVQKAYVGSPVPYYGGSFATKSTERTWNDPMFPSQWALINDGTICPGAIAGADIHIRDAWKLCTGDSRIKVAVVDEGICYTHPDLKGNVSAVRHNFLTGADDVTWGKEGDVGHATHVAGTIAAVNGNGTGICGIAGGTTDNPGVQLMSLQVFDGTKSPDNATLAKAFIYAADNGASILQCSLALNPLQNTSDSEFATKHPLEREALMYFMENADNPAMSGGIAIFAAGNEKYSTSAYPGAYKNIVSVTAFSPDWQPAWYTNFGKGCNIAAPGGSSSLGDRTSAQILSTVPDGYAYMEGTSMACPHVSGVAALGLSYAIQLGKHFTAEEFQSMLLTSVSSIDSHINASNSIYSGRMGSGAVDAWRMLMQVEGIPAVQVKINESTGIDLDAWFGEKPGELSYLTVTMEQEDMNALGMEAKPYVESGKLHVYPKAAGAAKITISAIAGGKNVASNTSMGGNKVSRTLSIIARDSVADNGGWL